MKAVLFISTFSLFIFFYSCEENCIIDIECEDCLPDYLPIITSHKANNGRLTIHHGEKVHLHCHERKFTSYPEINFIIGHCENGYIQINNDTKYLGELGCQSDYFDDISHPVNYCNDPFQGRSYQYHNSNLSMTLHLSEICYDPENRIPIFSHMTMSNDNNINQNQHEDNRNKLSVFGNLNKMFDDSNKIESEKLFENDQTINKKMKMLMGKDKFNFIDQTLIINNLLPAAYYHDQNGRITNFVSNKIAIWKSVALGNLDNLQKDIILSFKQAEPSNFVDIYVGTLGVLSLEKELYLKPNNKYPVPKYVWTIVFNKSQNKAVALILLNNPFVSITEIKSSVFCPSVCNSISWLKNLKRTNNYERSAYGLLFCCEIHSFFRAGFTRNSNGFTEFISNIPQGWNGLLRDSSA